MSSIVFTGTATGHYDLLDQVVGHLTGVGLGAQAWSLLRSEVIGTTQYRWLKGPGLSNTDEIFINLAVGENIATDVFTFYTCGAVAHNPALSWSGQPGYSPVVTMPVWDSAIPYWLIANGRRFIIISKISTTYQSLYAGFYIPYGTSSEMPYPIAVMSNCGNIGARWSTASWQISGFWDPVQNSSFIRHWDGAWVSIYNFDSRTDFRQEDTSNVVWPFSSSFSYGRGRDNGYTILPTILHGNYSGVNTYGELEGVYQVSGYSNASEDILDIGSDNYLVVQSVYKTTVRDYAAIKLG